MFSFGKTKLPADWPALHHKCNKSRCMFPNSPRPAPGTYNCRGCEKGTYTVSPAQAREVDIHGRNVFYVPGSSPPLNARPQPWDLNQEFPPFMRVDASKRAQTSRTQVMRDAQLQTIATKVVRAPNGDVIHQHHLEPAAKYRPHPSTRQQAYSRSSDHTDPSTASRGGSQDRLGQYTQPPLDARQHQRSKHRQYRVVNA
ncbi:hypothetical protein BT96DRAFT_361679 [Gymnopus androsaceus JB14]|uniref:Uncharacterized protein n=1 Tax=Gymnopus androsaceus JB14 TaxID=1447944 RepID=A0A6A4I5N4_9AGAR|nr:hypothetical protein BT96DRAFT_361679 [Gymnopus androsaceus JB14]